MAKRSRTRRQPNGASSEGGPEVAGNVTKENFRSHVGNLLTLQRKKREADSALSNAFKAAERDGLDRKELKRAMADSQLTTDQLEMRDRRYSLYREWLEKPVGYQGAMHLGEKQLAEEEPVYEADGLARTEAFEQGVAAGKAGANVNSGPFQPGSAEHQEYASGWAAGQQQAVEALGGAA